MTERRYDLRFRGKCSKASPGMDFVNSTTTIVCENCTMLRKENDRLRRQISLLSCLSEQLGNKVHVPSSSNVDVPFSNNVLVMDSSDESIDTPPPTSKSICVQTCKDQLDQVDACCGSDKLDDADPIDVDQVKVTDVSCQTNTLSDAGLSKPESKRCEIVNTNLVVQNEVGDDVVVQPFQEHFIRTFHELDVSKLDHDTAYSHTFSNRSVAYYGSVGYHYNGGRHEPSPFSQNKYLEQVILKTVRKQHPNFQFNSVLITRYANGDEFIPYHSDNEVCIDPASSILTISLGECRQLCFRPKSQRKSEVCLPLHHGDAILMTKYSQDFFEHSIPRESTKRVRISITLRNLLAPTPELLIKDHSYASKVSSKKTSGCNDVGSTLCTPRLELDPGIKHQSNRNCSSEKQKPKSSTVYISSSMFSALDSGKLSSKEQDATVFSYPGATVSTMHMKFQSDPKASKIDCQTVQRIFLLTGTNNIDDILNSPREMRDKIIDPSSRCSMEKLTDTFDCIASFVKFLTGWAPNAEIVLLKLLPRESRARNVVITRINSYLHSLASKYDNMKLLDFEKDRYLFANNAGYRKSDFFSAKGEDNVHLNRRGVVRLANHLKYIAHCF